MCGIAGSSNPETAFKLYQSNLNRGYYSSGSFVIDDLNIGTCNKALGVFTQPASPPLIPNIHVEGLYYLYHSRGPTVETDNFIPDNNHPFMYKDWVVAHNGIISNFDELAKKYFPEEDFTGKTDSCIIPRMLSIKPMKDALEELKGTFALWMWSSHSNGIYLCRSASTLFANLETGDFCSTEFENGISLQEGYIYKIDQYKKIIKTTPFKSNSPYFVL